MCHAYQYNIRAVKLGSMASLAALSLLSVNVFAEMKVQGDIRQVEAAVDALATAYTKLAKGEIDCKLKIIKRQRDVMMEGTYSWDISKNRRHFQGTYQTVQKKVNQQGEFEKHIQPLNKVEWFQTSREWCHHTKQGELARAGRKIPPHRTYHAPHAVNLDRFWFCYGTGYGKLRLDRLITRYEYVTTMEISRDADGRLVVEQYNDEPEFRSMYRFDPKQGGLLVEYEGMPVRDGFWYRSKYRWQKHPSGIWYPSHAEMEQFEIGSWDERIQYHELTVTRFDPNPDLSPKRLSFKAFDLKPGTYVNESTPSGQRVYVVGGESGKRAIFEGHLKSAAQRAKKSGFADPKRGKEKP